MARISGLKLISTRVVHLFIMFILDIYLGWVSESRSKISLSYSTRL